jgi:hypothetical protein
MSNALIQLDNQREHHRRLCVLSVSFVNWTGSSQRRISRIDEAGRRIDRPMSKILASLFVKLDDLSLIRQTILLRPIDNFLAISVPISSGFTPL